MHYTMRNVLNVSSVDARFFLEAIQEVRKCRSMVVNKVVYFFTQRPTLVCDKTELELGLMAKYG